MAKPLTTVDRLLEAYDPQDREWLPPEFLMDGNHPANDQFAKQLEHTQRAIKYAKARCKHRHAAVAADIANGKHPRATAEKFGYSPASIYSIITRPEVAKLIALLQHHQQAIDGPNTSQRVAMLHRIALRNEYEDPRTAIQAVEVINKMTGLYQPDAQTPTVIRIEFDHTLLPRTQLDAPRQPVTIDVTPSTEP